MISINFVDNGSSNSVTSSFMMDMFEQYVESTNLLISESVDDFCQYNTNYVTEAVATGNTDDVKKKEIASKQTNVFAKIGDAVISLFEKIGKIISKAIELIKDISFKFKSNEKKLDVIKKRYPLYADKIIARLKEKEIDINDVVILKSLSDIDKLYKEVLAEAGKPSTVDKLKTKADEFLNKLRTIGTNDKSEGGKETVITVGNGPLLFKKINNAANATMAKLDAKRKENYNEFLKAFEQLKKLGEKSGNSSEFTDPTALRKSQIISNIHNAYQGKISNLVSASSRKVTGLQGKINSFLMKFDDGGKLVSSLDKDLKDSKKKG